MQYLTVRCPKTKNINATVDELVQKYGGTFEGQYRFFRVYVFNDTPEGIRKDLRDKGINYNYSWQRPSQLISKEERAIIDSKIGKVFTRISNRNPITAQVVFIRAWKEGRYSGICRSMGAGGWRRRNRIYDTTLPTDSLNEWKERDLEFLSTFGSPHLVLKEAMQTKVRELEKRVKTTQSGINKYNGIIEKM